MAVKLEIGYETNDGKDVLSKHFVRIVRQARLLGSGLKKNVKERQQLNEGPPSVRRRIGAE